jgi:hypothetical protein
VNEREVVGVALVRVWMPVDSPEHLLIRLVATGPRGDQPIGVASTIAGATALLQAWLEGLPRAHPEDGSAPADRHHRPST